MSLAQSSTEDGGQLQPCSCKHCGTRFRPVVSGEQFCCSGCEYVYRLIQDESLDRFYDLRGAVSRPVGATVFRSADFNWLEPLVVAAETRGPVAKLSLGLEGISCVGCVWLVDHLFNDFEGGVSCRVNVQYGTLDLEWTSGAFDAVGFARRLKRFGYRVCPARSVARSESKQVVWRLGLCGAFALNGMLYTLPVYLGMDRSFAFAPHFGWLSALFSTASLLVGGSYFIGRAARAALQRVAHLDLPISVGIVFAYLASWYGMRIGDDSLIYFDFVTTFVFLMLAGRWLQVVAVERNRNRLADIALEAPTVEIESASGGRVKASADQLKKGDRYWLTGGQRVPVASRVLGAQASFAMDWISGETESRLVEAGGEIGSGAELENGFAVAFAAWEDWDESLLARLSRRSTRSTERDTVAQRWIFRYLLAALAVAVAGGGAWLYFGGLTEALMVFISILVVSCPCALGIAWPFADEIALAQLKRGGVFVTTHSLWNRLTRVRRVVFDKTGTLTRPTLSLLNPEVLTALDERTAKIASSLCRDSRHPVASAIREVLMAKGMFDPFETAAVKESVGLGLELRHEGTVWRIGRASWAEASGRAEGTCLTRDGAVVAELHFADRPLPDSAAEISALGKMGLELFVLSGDRQQKVDRVASQLGVADGRAVGDLTPDEKADWLRRLGGAETLMVGDGANDTLAFEEAGCCGAPANEQGIVAERADFHYLGSGIQGIRRALEMGKRRQRAVAMLVTFAIGYNALAVGYALTGAMTPLLAAVLMPLSSIASLAIVWSMLGGSE